MNPIDLKYYGHSCFELHINGKTILFDPFITPNQLASHISISEVKPDFICISHGHEDHIADAVQLAKQNQSFCIGIWETMQWLSKNGISDIHPMNIGGKRQFDFGKIELTPSLHSSSFPDGSYGGLACGFVISHQGKTIYYSGDTALFSDMKWIGSKHKIDLAILPIGGNFTMDAEDAVVAAEWLGVKRILGVHYNTFGYITIDVEKAKREFKEAGLELTILNPGETIKI